MSKDYFEKYKKDKEKEKETGSTTSQSSVSSVSKNSTFLGGGSAVKKTEERVKGPSEEKKLSVQERQNQKSYGQTETPKLQRRTEEYVANKKATRASANAENAAVARNVKSGTMTKADEEYTREKRRRTAEVVKNTGRAALKGAQDTATGYGKTAYDVSEMTAQGNAYITRANLDRRTEQQVRNRIEKEARESRLNLQEQQDKRQAEWDKRTKNATKFEKALYGAAESGTGMLIDTGVGALTGTGQFGALASMGLRTYGTTRGQAEKEGATASEDRLYSLAQAGKEVGTELMFQGAGLARKAYSGGKVGLSLADRAANVLTKGLTGKPADIVGAGTRLLGGTAEENIEELAGWGLDPLIKEYTYGKNVRERFKESLRGGLPEITNQADADKVASYFNTSEFTDELTADYRKSGLNEADARALAEEMRDYYVAYYSGDQETLERLEEDLSRKLSGQPGLTKEAWSKDELFDTFRATTLLTLATGLPGAVTTSVKGNQAFNDPNSFLRQKFGDNAINIIADEVKNTSDAQMSLKAETMKKRLDEGKDLTGTQKWDLMQGYAQKQRDTAKKAIASKGTVDAASRAQNLVSTKGVDIDGNIRYAKATEQEYNRTYAENELTVEAVKNYLQADNSISDDEARRSDAVNKAITDLHVGDMTVGDAHEFGYGNTLAREALKASEGIDLDQYVVRNADGTVNYAATNEATENALYAINAENGIKMAQVETNVYIDDTRGRIDADIMGRMDNNGQAVWKEINKNLDPRNIAEYLTTARAVEYFDAAGRNTDVDMNTFVNQYSGGAFRNVDKTVLKRAFAAGRRDRIIANTPGYGHTVEAGSNIKMKDTKPIITGQLIMDDDIKEFVPDSVQSAYLALAMSTNSNIHLVGDLSPIGKDGNPIINQKTGLPVQLNGKSHGNDIYINVNQAAEKNLGYVFMHEMTHQIKQYAPNEYLALENLVRDKWFNKDYAGMQRAIQSRIDLYKTKGGQDLTEEEALEEIIADAMAEAIDDPSFAAQICEEDITLGEQILNSIRAALRSIRELFAGTEYQNDDFHRGLLSYLNILDEAEKMWINALHTARVNKANGLIADWQDRANKQARYAVEKTTTNRDVVVVNDFSYRDDMPKAEALRDIRSKLAQHKRIPVHGQNILLTRDGRKEITRSNDTDKLYNRNVQAFKDKLNAAAHPYDILYASTDYINEELNHPRTDKFVDFSRGNVLIQAEDRQYDASVIVGLTKNNSLELYDIVDLNPTSFTLKKETSHTVPQQNADFGSREPSLSDETLSSENENVKESFSISEPVERVKDLIAVHNLKADDIRNTFELGGFPMPSIAITKDSMGHDMYGDISLLFGSDTIDPEFFRSNQVFGGDAWTPTFPATRYKPNEDIVDRLRDIYYDNAKTLGYDAMRPFYELAEDAENALNKNGGEQGLIDQYKNDIRAMRTFLKMNGKDVEDVVKRTEDTISDTDQKLRQHFIDTLGEDAIREFEGESIPHGKAMVDHRRNWTADHSDEIKSTYRDFLNREFSFSDEDISNVLDNMSLFEQMKLVRDALNYLNNGATTVKEEVDRAATDKAIEDAAHELGYEEWIDGLLTGIEEKRGIRNNKEFFTRNGNRRSWDALHDDITLENVVKVMKAEIAAGGTGIFGSNPKGAAQKQYKNLDEIRADEGRLQHLSEEEYKAQSEEAVGKMSAVCTAIAEHNPKRFTNMFGAALDVGSDIAEVLNTTKNRDSIQRKLKKDYLLDVTEDQMDDLMEAIDAIANLPTGYFEAKPRRAVGFDEVKAAIIPNNLDSDIKEGLQERGIPLYEYDYGLWEINSELVKGDRQRVLNEAATEQDVRFSISQKYDEDYMAAVEANDMETAQRLVDEAAKEAGYDIKAYHGTGKNFTQFDVERTGQNYKGYSKYGKGLYFADSEERANMFGKNRKLMGVYLNADNLFDATGVTSDETLIKEYNRLRREYDPSLVRLFKKAGKEFDKTEDPAALVIELLNEYSGDKGYSTKFLQEMGYDGIIVNHRAIADWDAWTEYVIFEPEKIKSSDPVTYAEDGSVIPLSERFDPNNDDIRYSLPTTDSDGNVLTTDQMEYFANSQARDAEGRLVPVYHTTNKGGFTIFDPMRSDDHRSLFFASNWDVSQTYGNYANSRFYYFDIDNIDDVKKYLDAYSPDRYFVTQEQFDEVGWEADMLDFENITNGKQSDFEKYLENPDGLIAIIGVPDYSPDSRSYADTWISASSPDELVRELRNHFGWQRDNYRMGTQHGYYACYLNLENPMIIDAHGQYWDDIKEDGFETLRVKAIKRTYGDKESIEYYVTEPDGYEHLYESLDAIRKKHGDAFADQIEEADEYDLYGPGQDFYTYFGEPYDPEEEGYPRRGNTRYWAEEAEFDGYDGVIIRNLLDHGGKSEFDGIDELSDIYIAFSSNQIKDINNVSPTTNPDIRYSITDEDEAKSQIAYNDAMDNSYELLAYYEQQLDKVNAETFDVTKAFKEEDVVRFLDALKMEDAVPSFDPMFEEDRVRRAKSKEEFFNNVNAKWNDRWVTEGEVLDIKSVKKGITNLVKGAMANSNSDAQYRNEIVRKTLIDARIAYQLMKQDRTELASYLLYHSAQRMMDGLEFIRDDTAFEEYKGIRDYLRTYRINVPDAYWQDEKFNDFRKEYYGRLRIGKGKSNIESVYQDLANAWPHIFNESQRERADCKSDPAGLLQHIGVVVDSNVTPFYEAYSSEEATSLAFDLADQLYDIIANGDRVVSLADTYKERFDAKTKALKQRHAEALLRERKIREEGIQKERIKFRTYKEEQKEKQHHSDYFNSIKKTYDELTKRLLTNTKEKHIPEQYKRELAELLKAFDFQTVGSKKREARTGYKAQKTIRMEAMRTALERIEAKSQFFHINDSVTDIMKNLLGLDESDTSQRSIEGKSLDELNASELRKIDKLLKSLLHEFNNYEKVKAGMKKMQAAEIGHAQNDISLEHAEALGAGVDYQTPFLQSIDRIINLDMMTPAYLFRKIDPNNEGLGLMWKEIRRSFDKYVKNTEQINNWIEEIVGEYHDKGILWNKYGSGELSNWRSTNYAQTFKLTYGTLQLTPAQMMSVACLANRKQAYDHMIGNGVVVSPVSFQAKLMSDVKKKFNKSLSQKLTDADIKTIVAALTPEQKQVANKLQELMATRMAEWGNEASMNVLGIRLFEDPDYFPIRSDRAGLTKDLDPNQFEQAIRNFGFTKAVQPGAKNAIMIDDIFDVVTEHCNNMNLYNSYTEAMNDFMKVYNYKETRGEEERTVEETLRHAFSDKAPMFIMQFMRDLNGNVSGRPSGIESLYNALLANAKKASVFANWRVAAQQPTALSRAFYVIDEKYLKGVKIEQGAMEEMFEHCPIALWKSWGYYDINMGKSIEDVIMNNGRWLEDKATDLYGALDNVTWTAIWQMVKAETKDLHPELKEGSDEFYEHCNERMSEIVDLTQVVDSPMHRSHAMRDKGFFKKMTTAFMAEPTLTANMLRDGLTRSKEAFKRGKKSLASQIFTKTIGVYLLQTTMVAAAQATIDALRGKNPNGSGDDDDRYLHLWWVNFIENWKDEFNPLGKIYVIKDLKSIMDGWEQRNLALQGVYYLSLGWRQLKGDPYARSKDSWYENLLYGMGYLSGIPIKTMKTGIRNALNTLGIDTPALDAYGEYLDSFAKKSSDSDKDVSSSAIGMIFNKSMDKVAEKMGYKPIGATSEQNVVSGKTSEKKTKKAETAENDARVQEYRESLSDNLSEDQKDKLVKQYQKTLDAETTAEVPSDMDVREHINQSLANAEFEMQKRSLKAAENAAGLTGNARNNALWDTISEGYTKSVDSGNMATIEMMREAFIENGGDADWFDAKITDKMKSAYKKTIYTEVTAETAGASVRQDNMRSYMLAHGVTDEEISEIVRTTSTARDLKAAMRIGNREYIMDELEPLVRAGLTRADYDYLYKYRNYGAKDYDGKYTDPKYKASTGTYIWPTQGTITSTFGYRNAPTAGASSNHPAIDIGAPTGTPVVAADGGVVISAGANGGYGNQVAIKHDDGTITYYSHLSGWNVNVGDQVSQGQQIAQVGSTGISTGPHLDFKVEVNGEPVDPLKYLSEQA